MQLSTSVFFTTFYTKFALNLYIYVDKLVQVLYLLMVQIGTNLVRNISNNHAKKHAIQGLIFTFGANKEMI